MQPAFRCERCTSLILHYPCPNCGHIAPEAIKETEQALIDDPFACINAINDRFGYPIIGSVTRQWADWGGDDLIEFNGKIRLSDLPQLAMNVIGQPRPVPMIYSDLRSELISHCMKHQDDCTNCDFYNDGKCDFDYRCPADF